MMAALFGKLATCSSELASTARCIAGLDPAILCFANGGSCKVMD